MGPYEYQVVPFVGQLKQNQGDAATVSRQLQDVITQHTHQGWEFYRIDKVGIEISPGCLASLLGARSSTLDFDQVIFRRPATAGA